MQCVSHRTDTEYFANYNIKKIRNPEAKTCARRRKIPKNAQIVKGPT